jgi:dipeptidyl aminopeptidase/acylaminoacyl peptidase
MKRALILILSIVLSLNVLIKSSKKFSASDMHKMRRLSSPSVSIDGKYVVYSVREWDQKTGKASSHLEYTDISTFTNKLLTNPGFSDMTPLFTPNFKNIVFFLSTRSGRVQVWYINFPPDSQTNPIQLTNYPVDIDNLKLSSNSLVFSAEVYFDCVDNTLDCTAEKNKEEIDRGSNTWMVFNKLFARHWDRWSTEGKGNHLFLQTIKQVSKDGVNTPSLDSSPIDLMKGMQANSPVPPFGGSELFDIKSDGLEVVFTCHLRTNDESWNTGWKTYSFNPSNNKLTYITQNTKARTQNPKYSPDGTMISYLAMNRPGLESDNLSLELFDSITQSIIKVTDSLDRSINDYMWYDGTTIIFTCNDINKNKLYIVDIRDPKNTLKIINDDRFSYNPPITVDYNSNKLIAQRSSFTNPDDLVIFNYDPSARKVNNIIQLTNVNQDNLSQFSFNDCESFMFKGGYGDQVQGWICKPIDFVETNKYPLAFLIHGGPEGAFESSWSYRWNPMIWSHRGYAVLMINPHGSSGQGIKFQDAVRDDWGGVPYQDLMTGLDYVLGNNKWINSNRMCALGASYGGYMVNWIQGQTDRFKCLVTHDGVFSTLTMFYATEELWFPYAEYCPRDKIGCNPFDSQYRDNYLRFSPESYVQNWKTPHLIIHGSMDFRIPISEGLSAFSALQVKNVKSRFLHFTQENHWVLKAENSIKWYDEVIGWLDQFTSDSSSNLGSLKLSETHYEPTEINPLEFLEN